MKKTYLGFIVVMAVAVMMLGATAQAAKSGAGISDPPGIPLYVIIEVSWDGVSDFGDWTVFGPKWDPVIDGPVLSSCTECLDMSNYEFVMHGKTLQFEEVMVPTVVATPQAKHVVLKDLDGDRIYTGSLTAMHYFPWRPEPDGSLAVLYFDRMDYEVEVDVDGNVVYFHYFQYEHKKLE